MKISLSSTLTSHHKILLLAILLIFNISPTRSSISAAVGRRHHHSCHPITTTQPPPPAAISLQLQRIRHSPVPPFPPPRDGGNEIDPRYGVEKRFVPSGPNPLHN
ncbi:CLAVATA3/ESR (CLE)-related protein 9 [Sesamum alatum]|uniref:CLAVATA3/ESR (CLE)-related protein 9 n=1 Tax=Sesamum alatum TaxID=300844 RepID=A0AAE1Y4W0_9LAMI|nr:CLAVATA3/ESR (CLE)-related protein 9 [Sesamum alatum]